MTMKTIAQIPQVETKVEHKKDTTITIKWKKYTFCGSPGHCPNHPHDTAIVVKEHIDSVVEPILPIHEPQNKLIVTDGQIYKMHINAFGDTFLVDNFYDLHAKKTDTPFVAKKFESSLFDSLSLAMKNQEVKPIEMGDTRSASEIVASVVSKDKKEISVKKVSPEYDGAVLTTAFIFTMYLTAVYCYRTWNTWTKMGHEIKECLMA